ncbi:MAG: glycogen debranching protein, partial [Parachlamydiaceae bacterium]
MQFMKTLKISSGLPFPFGTSYSQTATNFAVYCPLAPTLSLCLFNEHHELLYEIPLNRTGDVWHVAINHLSQSYYYSYKLHEHFLLDPYAKGTSSKQKWGEGSNFLLGEVGPSLPFDWEGDRPLNLPFNELIIYEMHVKGMTCHLSSQVKFPGTFLGLIEKIPYLRDLGINAIELLPIFEFNENACPQVNPSTQEQLYNYWGYSTLNFFSVMNRYASADGFGVAALEFKKLVRELHKNGIEIILDVVFNHTGEGNQNGSISSFKGLSNETYYIHDSKVGYHNYSGCGNTVNCNHPVVMQMILDCLRYWVIEMHVDGFRFDLASIFSRGENGAVLPFSPLVKAISLDPILSKTKLIAEPWDAAGLYQLGNFEPQSLRWSEWNDRYRDTIRSFIKGSPGIKPQFATALCGSQDYFSLRAPTCSINFVTAHDGFTLADLVSYNHKHNEINGEKNQDGQSFNDSWNCGVEGPTLDTAILALRERQMRNFHLALMVSQGIPMLHMGDEYGHTKKGNNNTWCQDNDLSWFLWEQLDKNNGFYRFYRLLVAFRKREPLLKHAHFLTSEEIDWHGCKVEAPCWDDQDCFLAFTLKDSRGH